MDNECKSFNKILNDKYHLLKEIANKYNYSEELLDMMTYIYMSFYMNFGKKCDYPLYDIFNKVKIIYEDGYLNDISVRNNFGSVSSDNGALTIFTPNLNVFKNASLKQNPQVILIGTKIGDYEATPILKIELLMHEVRHALTGYYNTNIMLNENTYYMRNGMHEVYYSMKKGSRQITRNSVGLTLGEITNTYITELLINKLLSLKIYNVENKNLSKYLSTLKTNMDDGRYRSLGYNSEVRLLYPLLLNETFINIVDEHEFDGNIDIIKDFINDNSSLSNYQSFCQLLDDVLDGNSKYQEEVKKENMAFISNHVSNVKKTKEIVLDMNNKILLKKL